MSKADKLQSCRWPTAIDKQPKEHEFHITLIHAKIFSNFFKCLGCDSSVLDLEEALICAHAAWLQHRHPVMTALDGAACQRVVALITSVKNQASALEGGSRPIR